MAFVVPCISIVVCYARIFYIVRKTAMRSHESASTLANTNSIHIQSHSNQSRKSISSNNNKNSLDGTDVQLLPPKITANSDELLLNDDTNDNKRVMMTVRGKGKKSHENLASISHSQSHEDLHKNSMKFIHTNVENDLSPALSTLKKINDDHKLCVSEKNSSNVSICRTVEFIDENGRNGGLSDRDYTLKVSHDMDSAVEESTSSTENNQVI